MGNNAPRRFCFRQHEHGIGGAADFKGSCFLQILAFEIYFRARQTVYVGIGKHRRVVYKILNALIGVLYIF